MRTLGTPTNSASRPECLQHAVQGVLLGAVFFPAVAGSHVGGVDGSADSKVLETVLRPGPSVCGNRAHAAVVGWGGERLDDRRYSSPTRYARSATTWSVPMERATPASA